MSRKKRLDFAKVITWAFEAHPLGVEAPFREINVMIWEKYGEMAHRRTIRRVRDRLMVLPFPVQDKEPKIRVFQAQVSWAA